jgi:plastocyanin
VAIVVIALATVGCGGDSDANGEGADTPSVSPDATGAPEVTFAPNGESVTVQALDNTFRVQDLTIAAGTEVVWDNVGRNDHNVVPVGDVEVASWGVLTDDFTPGDTYSHVFTAPGEYRYYCTIHATEDAGMIGTVIVTEP